VLTILSLILALQKYFEPLNPIARRGTLVSDQDLTVAGLAGVVGAVAGAFSGLVVGQAWDGLMAGGLVSAAAGAVGAYLYRPRWDMPRAAVGAIPYAGWIGGLAAGIYVHGGLVGAFVGCAIGYVGGLLLPALLMMSFAMSEEKQLQRATPPTNPSSPSDHHSGSPAVRTGPIQTARTAGRIDPERAANLAFQQLLAAKVRLDALVVIATELAKSIDTKTDHELALATALFFFEQQDLKPSLKEAQMMARLTMVQWLQDGEIAPAEGQHFENQLYKLFKP